MDLSNPPVAFLALTPAERHWMIVNLDVKAARRIFPVAALGQPINEQVILCALHKARVEYLTEGRHGLLPRARRLMLRESRRWLVANGYTPHVCRDGLVN